MSKQLRDDDAQVVDLLLDGINTNSTAGSGGFASPIGDGVVERIGAVEAVFRLLGEMPASEPPADLATRTMARIQERGNQPSAIEGQHPTIGEQKQAQ